MIIGKCHQRNLSGPVTIRGLRRQDGAAGATYYLNFLALEHRSGVLVLPVPMLDGAICCIISSRFLRGRPVSKGREIGTKVGHKPS